MRSNNTTKQAMDQYCIEGELMPIEEYLQSKIKVVGYPMIGEFEKEYKDFDVIINVSDEYYCDYGRKVMTLGKEYHWLPMGESEKDMGINSIFAALYVMYQSYLRGHAVLLHCHAGANRSPTVQACFYFMMTDNHIEEKRDEKGFIRDGNMLSYNAGKHLPDIAWIENWLRKCRYAFDNPQCFIGGLFDWTIDDKRSI